MAARYDWETIRAEYEAGATMGGLPGSTVWTRLPSAAGPGRKAGPQTLPKL